MPRLSDVFHRSAFRVGADRSQELSASGRGAEVFEVTDLLIPAGTDWGHEGYALGTLTVQWSQLVLVKLYLEVAAGYDGDGADSVILDIGPGTDYWEGFSALQAYVYGAQRYAWATNFLGDSRNPIDSDVAPEWLPHLAQSELLLGDTPLSFHHRTAEDEAPPSGELTIHVGIHAGNLDGAETAPLSTDVTVVQARAALFVI